MGDVLIITWQGGGAIQPAIGLGRELSARGHRVRVLAQPGSPSGSLLLLEGPAGDGRRPPVRPPTAPHFPP